MKKIQEWQKTSLWKAGIKYVGVITYLFTAEYDSEYTGEIDDIDKDALGDNRRFYPISDLIKILSPLHKDVNIFNKKNITRESLDRLCLEMLL